MQHPERVAPTSSRHLAVAPERRIPVLDHVPIGRTLHLVDLENQAGGTSIDRGGIARLLEAYGELANRQPKDHVIIGCNPALALSAKNAAPGAQVVHRRGPDGADLALLDAVADAVWVAQHYQRVVIASGDHIFTELAETLVTLGMVVNIVCRRGSISADLYRTAGTTIHWFEEDLAESAIA